MKKNQQVKILALASYYPHDGHPFSGTFTEKNLIVLKKLGVHVEVLAPRPFVPSFVTVLNPRWKTYSKIVYHEIRNNISIYRPNAIQIPRFGSTFWAACYQEC